MWLCEQTGVQVPKEGRGIRSTGAGVRAALSFPVCMLGNKLVFAERYTLPTAKPSLQPPLCDFFNSAFK